MHTKLHSVARLGECNWDDIMLFPFSRSTPSPAERGVESVAEDEEREKHTFLITLA